MVSGFIFIYILQIFSSHLFGNTDFFTLLTSDQMIFITAEVILHEMCGSYLSETVWDGHYVGRALRANINIF